MSGSYSSQQSSSSQRDVDRRLKAAISKRPCIFEVPTCNCGVRMQMMTSYTYRNPCRRFFRCLNDACKNKLFEWMDSQEAPTFANECLNIVIDKYGELAEEFESLKRKHEMDSSMEECMFLRQRCMDLQTQVAKKEKEFVERKKLIEEYRFLVGIVLGMLLSIFLVFISK